MHTVPHSVPEGLTQRIPHKYRHVEPFHKAEPLHSWSLPCAPGCKAGPTPLRFELSRSHILIALELVLGSEHLTLDFCRLCYGNGPQDEQDHVDDIFTKDFGARNARAFLPGGVGGGSWASFEVGTPAVLERNQRGSTQAASSSLVGAAIDHGRRFAPARGCCTP